MILIVGSQRTGSTLMSLILDSHPALTEYGDPDLPLLLERHDEPHAVYHAPIWTARYKLIHEANPDNKYVYMLRNLYAIASSMMRSSGESMSWAKAFSIEEIARSISGISDWKKQYHSIPILGKIYRADNIAKMAVTCAYLKSYALSEYCSHGLPVFPVRYEELVSNPESTLRPLIEFLGLDWDDHVLKHHETHEGVRLGGTVSNEAITTRSLEIWKQNLTNENIRDMQESVRCLDDIFDRFSEKYHVA